jgi:type VI secretion system secreted protein Hcp
MAADYFLKIDGIDGESQDQTHKNSIELESFSWSGHQASSGSISTGAGHGVGKVTVSALDCNTLLAKDTPKLFAALCSGTHIAKAVLTGRKSGGDGKQVDFVKITMSGVAISSVSLASGKGSIPSVTFALNFAKMEWEYKAQDAKGNVSVASTAGWDFKQNVKV